MEKNTFMGQYSGFLKIGAEEVEKDPELISYSARPYSGREKVENCISFDEDDCCQLTMNDMIELGLSGSDNSSALRDVIGEHFHIGSGNAKTMLRRINFSKITKEELYKVIHS